MSGVITEEIRQSLKKSVLCWLATADDNGLPNVSPKEIFAVCHHQIIIANIASPQSAKNIAKNPQVCLSFIDVLEQKGFQIKGIAQLLKKQDSLFGECSLLLEKMTLGQYPFNSIFMITPETVKSIVAPSYWLFPEMPVSERIAQAKKRYNL